MGNKRTGTLSKLSRRVRRNREHALKARGKREKEMQQVAFIRGFNLGVDVFKARILNATAGMEYEPTETLDAGVPTDSVVFDSVSESTLPSLGSVVSDDSPLNDADKAYFDGHEFTATLPA